tara:strand:- start:351 stop:734 length:384 start_codon:yes stop_codon:yes gene_type:complete
MSRQENLTTAQWNDIVMNTDVSVDTKGRMVIKNFLTHFEGKENFRQMLTRSVNKVACENWWNSSINKWEKTGQVAIAASKHSIVMTFTVFWQEMFGVFDLSISKVMKELVEAQYNMWTPPSETYLCM